LHYAALLLVTLGFAGLTIISVCIELLQEHRAASSRLAGAMGLFLFAISFVSLRRRTGADGVVDGTALHHAGLRWRCWSWLQDYRFLLVDAFLRSW